MIKIAYMIDSLGFGGAERQLSLLARALPEPFSAVVISLSDDIHPFGDALRAKGIDVVALPRRSGLDARRLGGAIGAIRKHRADIVHGFLDAANAYAFFAGRMLRKPVVLSLRNELLRVTGARAAVLTRMLRSADQVLVNSKAGADHLRDDVGVDDNKVLHIPNWIDPERTGRVRDIPGSPPTIGFVGRFARQKRLDILIDAFAGVVGRIPDARLILMGSGGEKEMMTNRIADLGIGGNVEIMDASPDIDSTLRRLHLFVMTSDFEGLPNSAMEALSMGIPIVSTPVGDVRELVLAGSTGVYLESNDPVEVADTIAEALADKGLLKRALTDGPTLVKEKFSLDRAVDKLAAAYQGLLA